MKGRGFLRSGRNVYVGMYVELKLLRARYLAVMETEWGGSADREVGGGEVFWGLVLRS